MVAIWSQMKRKIKEKDIKKNKNIILIFGGIIIAILLYFALSPYQQCVRGYVKMYYAPKAYYDSASNADLKAQTKAEGQVACATR